MKTLDVSCVCQVLGAGESKPDERCGGPRRCTDASRTHTGRDRRQCEEPAEVNNPREM